jgi:hypothetical protein
VTSTQIAAQLHAAVDGAQQWFQGIDETRTTTRLRPDGWCAREILGHLIDSATNNHRRFILGQSIETTRFDGYDQNLWVSRQRYDKVPWRDLVVLWSAYNRHLAHVMTCIPEPAAERQLLATDGLRPVTLGYVMEDYVVHLRHHLDQIRNLLTR